MNRMKQRIQPSVRRGCIDDEVSRSYGMEDALSVEFWKGEDFTQASQRVMETVDQIEQLLLDLREGLTDDRASQDSASVLEAAIELISQIGDSSLLRRSYQVLIHLNQGQSDIHLAELEDEFLRAKKELGFLTA